MKTMLLYYSYTGTVKALAVAFAGKIGAKACEVRDARPPGKLAAETLGRARAIRGEVTPVDGLPANFAGYDHFVVIAPVWGGYPAPAINNVFERLPQGCGLSLFLVSDSGYSEKEHILARLRSEGFDEVEYLDIKNPVSAR